MGCWTRGRQRAIVPPAHVTASDVHNTGQEEADGRNPSEEVRTLFTDKQFYLFSLKKKCYWFSGKEVEDTEKEAQRWLLLCLSGLRIATKPKMSSFEEQMSLRTETGRSIHVVVIGHWRPLSLSTLLRWGRRPRIGGRQALFLRETKGNTLVLFSPSLAARVGDRS